MSAFGTNQKDVSVALMSAYHPMGDGLSIGDDPRRYGLCQGIPCGAIHAGEFHRPHRAGQPGDDPELHRPTRPGNAPVLLMGAY